MEGGDFHAKVADAYLRIAEEHPERFVVVDADEHAGEGARAGRRGAAAGAQGAGGETTTTAEFPVLDRVPGQEHAIAFLRQAAARPHHAYLLAGPEGGGKQLARPRVRGGAALQARRVRRVPGLPARARGQAPQRGRRRARGPRHPRGDGALRDLAPGLPHRARARPQGVRDPRGRPAEPGGRRRAAEGPRGAARRRGADAALGPARTSFPRPCSRAATWCRSCPLSEGFVVETLVGEGADARSGRARRAAVRREPRPRPPARDGRRTGWRSATSPGRRSSSRRRGRPVRSRRPTSCSSPPSGTGRTSGRSRRRSSRRSWTSADAPRTPIAARSGGCEERHERQLRRAERDYVDRVLLGRLRAPARPGGRRRRGRRRPADEPRPRAAPGDRPSAATSGLAASRRPRAALAEDLNLNPRLVLEQAFLRLGSQADVPRSGRRGSGARATRSQPQEWCWHHCRSARPVGRWVSEEQRG